MSFDCKRCGACCRSIAVLEEMAEYDRGDGVCRHLTPGNLCAIYDERPKICRVDESCPPVLAPQEWRIRNTDECARLHLAVYGVPIGGS